MAAKTMSIAPQANPRAVLAALLCAAAVAASFLPGSSASAASSSSSSQLMIQTCGRTSNEGLCIDLLHSSNRSSAATTVRELAVVALTAARRSVLRARMRWLELSYRASGSSAEDRLVARCTALYRDCLAAGAKALGGVTFMPAYDPRVAHAVTALRTFPEKCQAIFDERKLVSPLEKVNRETEEKLRVASEIVQLLR